eukprot:NODE_86_length_2212_cov_84.991216_g64_i0.p1 GENE.NODE_86_length_2212_cov_84.991216_g64_i0~~NODE_86_length_2212_cov_84.991216_g64_i0.p1  ORF type:complete len:590 (+),score=138.14 NODE_86_length_2212_cov_84.991216_g64_i0:171-1940(+)
MMKRVGKYELDGVLGKGTYGTVRLARVKGSDERYAVKVLARAKLVESKAMEAFEREVYHQRKFHHPHILAIKDFLQTQNHFYIVLELASGGELFDYIVARQRLPECEASVIFLQLLSAVQEMHSKGVVHLDIKPENILLDESNPPHVKLCDFGLSATQWGDSKLKLVCGTPNYVAPEILAEPVVPYDGRKADIWSCGVTLFAMVSGRLPFYEPKIEDIFDRVRRVDYQPSRHFSPVLTDLIQRILVADPAQRLTLDEVIQHRWLAQKEYLHLELPVLSITSASEEFAPVEVKAACPVPSEALMPMANNTDAQQASVALMLHGSTFQQSRTPSQGTPVAGAPTARLRNVLSEAGTPEQSEDEWSTACGAPGAPAVLPVVPTSPSTPQVGTPKTRRRSVPQRPTVVVASKAPRRFSAPAPLAGVVIGIRRVFRRVSMASITTSVSVSSSVGHLEGEAVCCEDRIVKLGGAAATAAIRVNTPNLNAEAGSTPFQRLQLHHEGHVDSAVPPGDCAPGKWEVVEVLMPRRPHEPCVHPHDAYFQGIQPDDGGDGPTTPQPGAPECNLPGTPGPSSVPTRPLNPRRRRFSRHYPH